MHRIAGISIMALGLAAAADAAILSVNPGNSGANTERGIAFDLTNNSATETVKLTGVISLAVTSTTSETFSLWTRNGTVLGNIGAGATNWTDQGDASATGQGYVSPTFSLTTFTFVPATDITIAPGATLGIWLKDNDGSQHVRYAGSGSPAGNATMSTADFAAGGSLLYVGQYGLGSTGTAPNVANATFGPTRNLIGQVAYTVVPVPEPAAVGVLATAGLILSRRRR